MITGFNAFQFVGNPGLRPDQGAAGAQTPRDRGDHDLGPPKGDRTASVVATLRPLLPAPRPGAPGPLALSDPDRLSAFATQGGLTPDVMMEGETKRTCPDLARALRGVNLGGVAIRAAGLAGEAAVTAAHAAAPAPFRQADGSFRFGARYMAVLALA